MQALGGGGFATRQQQEIGSDLICSKVHFKYSVGTKTGRVW
jgi:hypothetical protein